MSLFYTLSAASQSLITTKRAIDITNKNMSNVYTEGYTRKNSVIQDLPLAGIDIATVERAFDKTLFNRYINLNQELSGDKRYKHGLEQIESIFNDVQGSGFSTALNDFFNSFNDIAVNPDDLTARYKAITSANELVGRIRNSAENIQDIRQNTIVDIKDNVTKLNQLTSQLAKINEDLKTYNKKDETRINEYLDKRDNLIREISKLIDVKIKINSDNTVNLNTAKGFNLVLNDKSTNLEYSQINGEYQLKWEGINIANEIKNGEIGGNLKTLQFLDETEKKLDDFVSVLALTFNKQHRQGYDLYGNSGKNFFSIDPASSSTQIKASNIYVNISDPKEIAAASDPTYTNSDNTNIKALLSLKDNINGVLSSSEESTFLTTGLTLGGITYKINDNYNYTTIKTKSFGEAYNSLLVAPVGFEVEKNNKNIESVSFLFEAVDSKMKEISSVNLDEELINLTKLQRAYQASAKIINVTDELLQTVMNLVR